MKRIHPKVEEAVDTLDLNAVTRRRLLSGAGLASASLAATALLSACSKAEEPASRRGRQLPEDTELEVGLRLPRHDQPVLHPDPVRRRGRLQAAGHLVPVDRVEGLDRGRDGQRDQHRGQRQGRRHRGRRGRQDRVPAGRSTPRSTPGSRSCRTTPTAPATIPGSNRLAYIGQGLYESGYALGQRALTQVDSGDVAAFIATPGQLNIQPRIDGAQQAFKDSGKPVTFTAGVHQRRRHQGSVHHRRVRPGAPEPGRHARGGRRFHPVGGPDRGQVQDARQGPEGGRRLRPGTRDARPRSRAATSTTPSTSSRTCRASCRSSRCTSTSCPAV